MNIYIYIYIVLYVRMCTDVSFIHMSKMWPTTYD